MTKINSAQEWFAGKGADEIERILIGRRLFFPDTVKRRDPKDPKNLIEEPVYLQIPSVAETATARVEALAWAREQSGDKLLRTEDQVIAVFGMVNWAQIQLYCVASHAIWTREAVPTRWQLPQFLLEELPRTTMFEVWARVEFLTTMEDVRANTLSFEEMEAVIRTIVEKGNLSPLVAIADGMQNACLVYMAHRALMSFQTPNS